MKLKPPKTWHIIVAIISAIVLAIGGSFLAVYLKTGFKPVNTPPKEIVVDDVDSVFNATTSQYEVVSGFRLKITTPTENVNQNEITLSFPSGIYTTTTEDGKISNGIIIVPQKVKIDEVFNVQLVQEAYIGENGECMINKGGISKLLFTTQNTELSSSQIQIAVDVPAVDVKVEAYSATTGDKLTENETGSIAQGTNFVLKTTFYPEASRYMFSDDNNSAVTTKREKRVYFESASSNEGVSFKFNNGDVYFEAGNETSANNLINAYSFATATEQATFDESNSQLAGLPLYAEAIRVLSTAESAVKTQMKIDIVEANVGSFSINPTEGAPLEFTVNKLFKVSAGASTLTDAHIAIRIRDIHDNDLSAMIKNVGLRILSIKNLNNNNVINTDISSYVVVKGGATKTFDGEDYVLINSNVKNLNHANWEISTNGEYEITAEVKLFVQDENGTTYAFDDETERKVYMKSQEHVESDIYWETGMTEEGISMTIVYDKNGDVLSSQYGTDLRTVAHVPVENVYQKKVFFAYYDAAFPEGKDMGDYISVATEGAGMYTIFSGENKKLYPLIGDYELIAKEAIDFNLVFATVRTDAYGNPTMNASGTYIIEKISTKVLVSVKKTLQGFSSIIIDNIEEDYFVEENNYYAIPTGVEDAFTLKLTLKEAGDAAIFAAEKSKIKLYSSAERNGTEDAGVFEFGEMTLEGEVVSVSVSVKADVNIGSVEGKKYFVRVEYDNSVKVLDWTAQPADGDNQEGIMIYNQRPSEISNEMLGGKHFVVYQTMNNMGGSTVLIKQVAGEGEETIADPLTFDDLDEFNTMINGTVPDGTGEEKYTIVKDCYGREFDYNYTISSTNSQLVIVNNADHKIAFGSGEGDVDVSVTAGEHKFTFYLSVSTSGVTSIEVNGEAADISNPRYSLFGAKNENVILKNTGTTAGENGLLDVYVTDGTYDPSAYKITLKNKPDGIDDMITFDTAEDGECNSFTINENFGDDVVLLFNATNDAGTLNFTFNITIKKYAFEEEFAFGRVKYGEDTISTPGETIDQIGVADADKGENFDSSAIYVYAAFPIDLNTYFKVRLGNEGSNEYIDWSAARAADDIYLTTANGDMIGTVNGNLLTFNDVYEPTAYTFTLYANTNGSRYAFYKDIAVTVCPNFKLVQTSKEFSILNLQSDNDFESYFQIKRTTLSDQTEDINKLDQISGYDFSNYVSYSEGKIIITNAPFVDYGEEFKQITISLKADPSGADEKVVATCGAGFTIGVTIDKLINYSTIFDQNNIVRYNGAEAIWISNNSADLNDTENAISIDGSKKLIAKLIQKTGYYRISNNTINFISPTSASPIVAGSDVYLQLKFYAVNEGAEGDEVATWKIPYVWSRVGSKVASYKYEDNAVRDVAHTINNPDTQQYYASVVGGQDYYLVAPFEYYINSANQLMILETTSRYVINEETATLNEKQITIAENYELEISGMAETISPGQSFTINTTTYYYKEYEIGENNAISAIIYKAYVGNSGSINVKWNGNAFETAEDTTYTIANGIYGKMLMTLDDVNFLTGLNQSDFGDNKGNIAFGSIINQKYYTILNNKLCVNDIVGEVGKTFYAYFVITQSANGSAQSVNNCKYNFYLSIEANATAEDNVTYPYNGDTEMLNIESNNQLSINMTGAVLGAETQNAGKTRIADKIEALDGKTVKKTTIATNATLKIKELSIDNSVIVEDASAETAGNGIFAVSIVEDDADTWVKFVNNGANTKNVKVVVKREYPNVYGADLEYSFSINASNIRYLIAAAEPSSKSSIVAGNNGEYTWTLANTSGTAQTINITTKQLNESGASSNVDKNKVVTTLTTDLDVGDYTIEYTYNAVNPQLSIKLPTFVDSEKVGHVYFSVNGTKISTITIKIPATITASKTCDSQAEEGYDLIAGKTYTYSADDLASLVNTTSTVNSANLTSIQIVDEDGVETTHDYVSVNSDKMGITILNAKGEQSVRLKFNYTYEGKNGFAIFDYAIQPNVAFKTKLGTQNVVAGTDYKKLEFEDLQNNTTIGATGFELRTKTMDTNLFESIQMSKVETIHGNITVKTKYVAQTTAASVVVTISYSDNSTELFTHDIEIPFVIYPAVQLNVNYPNPDETAEPLTYESVVSGTGYNNFLKGTAEFASAARFQAKTGALNGSTVGYGEAGAFNIGVSKVSVKEYNNMATVKVGVDEILTTTTKGKNTITTKAAENVAINSTFTFTRGTDTGSSYVILQITYKGVTIEYTVYVFDTVVQGKINATTNRSSDVETIYADRVDTANLFNKNRLLEIEVTSSATVGAICYPYVVNLNESGEFESIAKQLLQFKIESRYIGRTIYVDSGCGGGVILDANQKVWFLAEEYVSGEGTSIPTVMSGVIFKRTAGRIEYTYATADSADGIRINYEGMTIDGTSVTETTTGITTHTVGYTFNQSSPYLAEMTYKTIEGLDFAVDRAYDATSNSADPVIVEISAHKAEYYRLVEQAGLRHPSTGEYITVKSMGNASLSYEVVNFKDETPAALNYPLNKGMNNRGYMSTNANGDDYLKLHDIAETIGENGTAKNKIYDYYLLGLGCAADGDYVLLKITYSLKELKIDFYVAFMIVPDYVVTLGGTTYAPENGEVSNKVTPYLFTPSPNEETENRATMLVAENNGSSQLVSVVRENWNQINIAYSFDYTIKVSSDSEYNAQNTINKLNLVGSVWTEYTPTDTKYYKPKTTTIKIVPHEVVFGTKKYVIEIVDDYNYVINFYFNLVPASDQTPMVYDVASSLTFTEGEAFDIGLIYDSISINAEDVPVIGENGQPETETNGDIKTEKNYFAEIEYSKVPESESLKKIILQNIDAWGLTTPLPNDASLTEVEGKKTVAGIGNYSKIPRFQGVVVTGVSFKYENDRGVSVKDGFDSAKQIKISGGSSDNVLSDIGTSFTYKGTTYVSKLIDGSVQLSSTIRGQISKVSVPEGSEESETPTYNWIATLSTGVQINGTVDTTNNTISYNGSDYAVGSTIIEIKDGETVLTKYDVKTIDIENGIVELAGTYNSFVNSNSQTCIYLGKDSETETVFELTVKEGGRTLATEALFWENANDKYRVLTSGYYVVPVMDGWIYGLNDTANVTVLITLQYGTGYDAESCVVAYSANIARKAKFTIKKKVVTDAVEFNLNDYIQVTNAGTSPVFYDDTLAVTIPSGGQAVISVNVCDNTTKKWRNSIRTINNTSTLGQKTQYLSISQIYGKTISPENNTVRVSWYGSDGAYLRYANKKVEMSTGKIKVGVEYNYSALEIMSGSNTATYKLVSFDGQATDNYAGSKIKVGDQEAIVGFADSKLKLTISGTDNEASLPVFGDLTIGTIEQDTLYIENANNFASSAPFAYNITKSYIIGTNGTFYQYNHNFTMTPRYAYFNDGLGKEVVKEIESVWVKDYDGYTVTLDQWAGVSSKCSYVKVAPAVDESGTPKQGKEESLVCLLSVDKLGPLYFSIGKEEGSFSEAKIDSNTGKITTGANYKLNHDQYILVRIWIKASGGPGENQFNNEDFGNVSYKKLLGELRIYLTERTKIEVESEKEFSLNDYVTFDTSKYNAEFFSGELIKLEMQANSKISLAINSQYSDGTWESELLSFSNDADEAITKYVNVLSLNPRDSIPTKWEVSYGATKVDNNQNASAFYLGNDNKWKGIYCRNNHSTTDGREYYTVLARSEDGEEQCVLAMFDNQIINKSSGAITIDGEECTFSFNKVEMSTSVRYDLIINKGGSDENLTPVGSGGGLADTENFRITSPTDGKTSIKGKAGDEVLMHYMLKLTDKCNPANMYYKIIELKFCITESSSTTQEQSA